MAELYLITGFLGAGKTSFLKELLNLFSDKHVYLIINEFGKAGVDGALLSEMNAALAEINNGSIFCACRLDKFEEALSDALLQKPEIILVEASGLSDPTNIQKVLSDKKFGQICYKGGICLVDAVRIEKTVHTARMCQKQLAICSLALINKTDIATKQQLETAVRIVSEINPAAQIEYTSFGKIKQEWLNKVNAQPSFDEEIHGADITLQKQCVLLSENMPLEALRGFLKILSEDTYRIKGFAKLFDKMYLIDCVGPMIKYSEYTGEINENPNEIVLLAGKGMALRKALKQAVQWYGDYIIVKK